MSWEGVKLDHTCIAEIASFQLTLLQLANAIQFDAESLGQTEPLQVDPWAKFLDMMLVGCRQLTHYGFQGFVEIMTEDKIDCDSLLRAIKHDLMVPIGKIYGAAHVFHEFLLSETTGLEPYQKSVVELLSRSQQLRELVSR